MTVATMALMGNT